MINKRLISLVAGIKARTAKSVLFQWLALICSVAVTVCICVFLDRLMNKDIAAQQTAVLLAVTAAAIILRAVFVKVYSENNALTARIVKKELRSRVFDKLCRLGISYKSRVSTAEALQVGVEGVEQLETYVSAYLPQLFYALAATFTLFGFLCFVNFKTAIILLVCIPIIPLSIVAVQKIAKKLLSKYWDSYTDLGDSFLENIQGLTTLKIYRSDGIKHEEMNKNAELFRRATMRVLIMQLNSISIMDIVAYGGAAVGIAAAVVQLASGNITFFAAMVSVLLSAEFFIPLRQLGSFFHVAMNGNAAADKIFRILDTEEKAETQDTVLNGNAIEADSLSFAYDNCDVLKNISLSLPKQGLYALAGKSGCGKSTMAGILTGQLTGYKGSVTLGGKELSQINERRLLDTVTLVSHNSHIFKGTVRYNLMLGNKDASDGEMIDALRRVRLWEFISSVNGLDTEISEQGANFSGGQRQRLALARALLHNTPVYIFDEATSNIDIESEKAINEITAELSKSRLVIVISHRLANIVDADCIFALEDGVLTEKGTHAELMDKKMYYNSLYTSQHELESLANEGGDRNE